MPLKSLNPAIDCLREATPGQAMWSEALPLITKAFRGVGAACFACNDQTGGATWARFFGPLSDHTVEYLDHHAELDPYKGMVAASIKPSWLTLSHALSERALRRSEWYHDFVRSSGINDMQGIQLHRMGPHRVFFGIHYQTVQTAPPQQDPRLNLLMKHLEHAARLEHTQRMLNLKTALGGWVIDHLGEALFVVDDTGWIIEMNVAAARIVSDSKVLAIRSGKLVAVDTVQARQLAMLIAGIGNDHASQTRMLVEPADHRQRQLVSVFPLKTKLAPNERATLVVRVVDLVADPRSGTDLADLFGFTPAEDRLVQALIQGNTLQGLTKVFGMQMPGLRVQMRSIMGKCGVQRQGDLLRVVLGAC